MRALEIQFAADGSVILPNREVEGERLVLQNVLVNLLQGKNFDPIFSDRGVAINDLATSGALKNGVRAQQEANFAANDLLFFSREWEAAEPDHKPRVIQLTAEVVGDSLNLLVAMETVGGQRLSFPVQTPA
jgi:hypothetical protein